MESEQQTLGEIFEKGTLLTIDTTFRFLLEDPFSLFYIQQGVVDLFFLQLDTNITEEEKLFLDDRGIFTVPFLADLLDGRLNYVGSGKYGEILFPFAVSSLDDKLRIVAVATTPLRIYKYSFTNFLNEIADNQSLKQEFCEHIERWVEMLLTKFTVLKYKPISKRIQIGQRITISSTDSIGFKQAVAGRNKGKVAWMKIISGQASIILSSTEDKSNIIDPNSPPFPLVKDSYLAALGEAKLQSLATEALLQNHHCHKAMLSFHTHIKKIAYNAMNQELKEESRRIKKEIETEQKDLAHSLLKLSKILAKEEYEPLAYTHITLLSALKLVGRHSNFNVQSPPDLHSLLKNPEIAIQKICAYSSVNCRKITLKEDWWERTIGPLLCFDNEGSPLVALPSKSEAYVLIDPATQKHQKVTKNNAKNLKSTAFCFYRHLPPKKKLNLKDILGFLLFKEKQTVRFFLSLCFISAVLSLYLPFANKIIFDRVITNFNSVLLFQLILGAVVIAISRAFLILTNEFIISRLVANMDANFSVATWNRILGAPIRLFRGYLVEDLYIRFNNLNEIIRDFFGNPLRIYTRALFAILLLVPMFYFSWWLALTGIFFVLFLGVLAAWTLWENSKLYFSLQQSKMEANSKAGGFIAAIFKIRTLGMEKRVYAAWELLFDQYKYLEKEIKKNERTLISFDAASHSLSLAILLTMVMYYIHHYGEQEGHVITLGSLIGFLTAYIPFLTFITQAYTQTINLQYLQPTWARSKVLLENPLEDDDSKLRVHDISGEIVISHVSFNYPESSTLILKDINMKIRSGDFIAIVGETGSGKSTLLRLMLGLETPDKGNIYFDNKSIKTLNLSDLRSHFGVVLQQSSTLSDTIRENITGGKPYTDEEILKSVRFASLEEDLANLPLGIDTLLGSGGATFSGGQIQRFLIARAIIGKPKIIFFDEATSYLDNKTQKIIMDNLNSLDITRIVVAHRISTIRNADRIFFLHQGKIEESGTFDELLKLNGLFSNFLLKRWS